MFRGIYTGASGMIVQQDKMDAVANNMANVDKNGYKRDVTTSKSFPQMLLRRTDTRFVTGYSVGAIESFPLVGGLGTGAELNEVFSIFEQGIMKETGNAFDLALEGKGFFVIENGRGEERYTRNGSFQIDKNGLLVNKNGLPVMGEEGYIHLKANNFIVDADGRIYQDADFSTPPERLVVMNEPTWRNMELVDTLKIVDFEETRYIRKEGDSLWRYTSDAGVIFKPELGSTTMVRQSFLEGSNVNPVTEMVRMIEVNRAYEANSKMVQSQDHLYDKLINEAIKYS